MTKTDMRLILKQMKEQIAKYGGPDFVRYTDEYRKKVNDDIRI